MAKVEYADAIKTVSGALTKINKKSPHAADQKMELATHRVAPTQTEGSCNRLYIRGLGAVTRATPVTAKEIAIRERFIAVQAAVNTRANSLEHVTSDQAALLAQKDSPTGKKTMQAYLWKVCGEAYDAEHPRS
jgi:hypothetical protein